LDIFTSSYLHLIETHFNAKRYRQIQRPDWEIYSKEGRNSEMAFFGADGLDHQIKHLKTQLAQKGW
jgi:hypothetical protein